MQTIEDLKLLGFHTDNFVICTHPASVVDVITRQQAEPITCSCCNHSAFKNEIAYVVHRLTEVTPKLIEKINNSKLVSIYLPILKDRKNVISYCIIDV